MKLTILPCLLYYQSEVIDAFFTHSKITFTHYPLVESEGSCVSKFLPLSALDKKDEMISGYSSRQDSPPTQYKMHYPRSVTRRSFLHQLDRFLTELQMTEDHLREHAFLSGNYAPVTKENVALPVQVVQGKIPEGLWGAFCRNGPNPVRERQKKRYHWFDGHAMLHTLMIKDGEASYTNQYIPSPRYQIEQELGEEYFPTIGEYNGVFGLLKVMFHRQMVKEKIVDNKMVAPPNTNILMYNNKLYCLHEACLPMECRMHRDGRLEYVGYETFDNVLDYPVSAHPIKDGSDLLFHSYSIDKELIDEHGTMKVGMYKSQTNTVDTYFVPTPDKSHVSFAHSLTHTKHYIIVWDCSVHFEQDALFTGGSFFRNNKNYSLKFGLIPKNATSQESVIWIDSGEAGAILHPLHSWEEVEETYLNGGIISSRTVIKLWTPWSNDFEMDVEQSNSFHMMEFIIDIQGRTASRQVIDETLNSEFAVMPPPVSTYKSHSLGSSLPSTLQATHKSKETVEGHQRNQTMTQYISTLMPSDRYGFSAIYVDRGTFVGYAKWDMMKRCLDSTVYYGKNEFGGEPVIFRAERIAQRELHSHSEEEVIYVGSYLFNEEEDLSYFVLYDGETNQQVCRLKMPQRVPFGFHGQFIPGTELESHFWYHGNKTVCCHNGLWGKILDSTTDKMDSSGRSELNP